MKELTLTVNLTFAGEILIDTDYRIIAKNVMAALRHATETYGIAPNYTYTTSIEVRPDGYEEFSQSTDLDI